MEGAGEDTVELWLHYRSLPTPHTTGAAEDVGQEIQDEEPHVTMLSVAILNI